VNQLGFFVLLIFSLRAIAIPSLQNKCGEKGINISLPSDSDIIAFNKECDTAYIGPPASGEASVVSAVPSTNLSFCPGVKMLPEAIARLMLAIDFWMERLVSASNEYLLLEKQHDEERALLINWQEEQSAKEAKLGLLEQELSELVKEAKEAKNRLTDCQDLYSPDACMILEQDFIEAKKSFIGFRNKYVYPLIEEISKIDQRAKTLDRKLHQLAKNIEANIEVFDGYKRRLSALRNEAVEDYSIFGAIEGMTVQILFESKWARQLENVRRQNESVPIHIESLPITKSMAYVDTTIVNGSLNLPSSLMYANVPGFIKTGSIESVLPTGETTIDNLDVDVTPVDSFLSGASGKIVLSLIGSCALTDARNRIKRDLNFHDMTSFISINSFHEFPILYGRRYKVHFRLSKFAEEIEKRTEKGGFFETTSVNEIANTIFDQEDFDIDFQTDLEGYEFTPEEKRAITIDVKKDIIDRVLKEIAILHQVTKDKRKLSARPKKSGAEFINDELECFGYSYCYAAKFIVGVFDSILGVKDAVAKFKANNNRRLSYTYSDAKPVTRTFTTTFSPRNR
jgi:hypothetical protein